MRRVLRAIPYIVGIPAVLALVGPFLVPVAPLAGTVAPELLADPDSQFVDLNGLRVHLKAAGTGEPGMLLLHGFGASTFSFSAVMGALAESRRVVAFDRPAFGLSQRPMPGEWTGLNPYSPQAQVDLLLALLDQQGMRRAVLVGHSAGGTIATEFALQHPERVEALILVDPALYAGGMPAWTRAILQTPQMRHLGPLIARSLRGRGSEILRTAWHDPSRIKPATIDGYTRPLQADNWDRALWELAMAGAPSALADRLGGLRIPVLVMTGDDDRIVPAEDSVRAAGQIPGARLFVVPDCGHLPHEECPDAFLQAVTEFLSALPGEG